MESEELKPLPEDLFDPSSTTHRAALDELREHLLRIGYRVTKRPARERTLRVYLDDGIDYPLLNPIITTIPADVDEHGEPTSDVDMPVMAIAVFSKGDPDFDERLATFPRGDSLLFIPGRSQNDGKGFVRHGTFLIELPLRESGETEVIDFPPVVANFRTIRRFLLGDEVAATEQNSGQRR